MDLMEGRVGAIGHSHVALWFHRDGDGQVTGATAEAGLELDLSQGALAPEPRRGGPAARW